MKTKNAFCVLSLAMIAIFFIPLPAIAMDSSLLEMSEQMDVIEKQDFQAAIDKATSCIRARNFPCAELELSKAAKVANSGQDKKTLLASQNGLKNEKQQLANEIKRAEEQRQAQLRRDEEERQAQNQAEEKRQAEARASEASAQESDSGSTMRGLLTIVQMTSSNYNSAMVDKLAAQSASQQSNRVAMAAEAANNERLMKAEYESRHPKAGQQQAVGSDKSRQQQVDNAKLATAPRNAGNSRAVESPAVAASAENAQSNSGASSAAADDSWRKCGPHNKCLVGDGYQHFCSGPAGNVPMCKSECQMDSYAIYHDTTLAPGAYIPGDYKCPAKSCNVINSCD